MTLPYEKGYFGNYGGRFVPETLMSVLDELTKAYNRARAEPAFWAEFDSLSCNYSGRPTPLYFAEGLTKIVVVPGFC
jgi:tryptophan synthase beta chain